MNNRQIRKFFLDKDVSSSLTDELVAAGFKQKSGGYIKYAKQCNDTGVKSPYSTLKI